MPGKEWSCQRPGYLRSAGGRVRADTPRRALPPAPFLRSPRRSALRTRQRGPSRQDDLWGQCLSQTPCGGTSFGFVTFADTLVQALNLASDVFLRLFAFSSLRPLAFSACSCSSLLCAHDFGQGQGRDARRDSILWPARARTLQQRKRLLAFRSERGGIAASLRRILTC